MLQVAGAQDPKDFFEIVLKSTLQEWTGSLQKSSAENVLNQNLHFWRLKAQEFSGNFRGNAKMIKMCARSHLSIMRCGYLEKDHLCPYESSLQVCNVYPHHCPGIAHRFGSAQR